jgi:hypothetical protein
VELAGKSQVKTARAVVGEYVDFCEVWCCPKSARKQAYIAVGMNIYYGAVAVDAVVSENSCHSGSQ